MTLEWKFISSQEAADLVGVTRRTIRRWVHADLLTPIGSVDGLDYFATLDVLRAEAKTREHRHRFLARD